MNKPNPGNTSVGLRIATAMYQMGIEGLPRNYELVYEAYSGGNPELTREFVALGKNKTQRALDELGKKYLPHHHEETVVAKTNERMRTQMSTFMNLLEEEKSSLDKYGKVIQEASETFKTKGELDRETISRSIQDLTKATEQQVSKSESMSVAAARQATELESVKSEIDNFERMKFVDVLTGLGNRRAFNKAVARVYANPALPMMCGLAYAEIDDFRQLTEIGDKSFADHFIRHVGGLLQAANMSGDLIVRLDGDRFGFLINSSDEAEIMRVVDRLRGAAGAKPLVNPKTGRSMGNATLSFGVAVSAVTDTANQLMAYAEKAMVASTRNGGNQATLYSNVATVGSNKGWIIYKPDATPVRAQA